MHRVGIESLCISAAFILFVKLYSHKCPDMAWLTVLALSNPESLRHQVHISLDPTGLSAKFAAHPPWNTETSNRFKFPWTTNQYPIVIRWFFCGHASVTRTWLARDESARYLNLNSVRPVCLQQFATLHVATDGNESTYRIAPHFGCGKRLISSTQLVTQLEWHNKYHSANPVLQVALWGNSASIRPLVCHSSWY